LEEKDDDNPKFTSVKPEPLASWPLQRSMSSESFKGGEASSQISSTFSPVKIRRTLSASSPGKSLIPPFDFDNEEYHKAAFDYPSSNKSLVRGNRSLSFHSGEMLYEEPFDVPLSDALHDFGEFLDCQPRFLNSKRVQPFNPYDVEQFSR
jgi:hypothetical protein